MNNNKTMQQIADDIGVSKQTVFRCIRDNKIKETGKVGNAFVYDPATVEQVMGLLGVEKPKEEVKEDSLNNEEDLEAEVKRLREAQEELHKEFAKEREELRADYREQLYSKDKQIEDLHKLLDQQQQLALVNYNKIETLELELKEQEEAEEVEEPKEEKKGWSFFNIFK